MEYVHRVTEEDTVLGKISRKECVEKAILHRAAAILVFNHHRDIFVHKRSSNKEFYPDLWDGSVGGAVQWNESYEEAAKRELLEELGITAALTCEAPYKYRSENLNYNGRIFTCITGDQPVLQSLEIKEGKWMLVEDLIVDIQTNPRKYIPDFLVVWDKYLSLEKGLRTEPGF
ncbi:MAG: NUDIX domain-containing protein [Candidatus Odinarchaeota archaeon]